MSSSPVRDVLLPASDRTALIQVVVVFAATVLVTFLVRKERSLMLLSVGVGLVVLALMAMRTLH